MRDSRRQEDADKHRRADFKKIKSDLAALTYTQPNRLTQESVIEHIYTILQNIKLTGKNDRAFEDFFDLVSTLKNRKLNSLVHVTEAQVYIGIKIGIKDFRHVSFENLDLSAMPDFSDVLETEDVPTSLDGALFKNTRVGHEDGRIHFSLFRYDVVRAHMESIRIGTELINLVDDVVRLTKRPRIDMVRQGAGSCPEAEVLFSGVLDSRFSKRDIYNFAAHVVIEGHSVGIVKTVGEKTMLATRTVYAPDGTIVLLKGVIYALDDHANIMQISGTERQTTRIVEAIKKFPPHTRCVFDTSSQDESLRIWPLRFFSRPWMYAELSKKNTEVEHAIRTSDCAEIRM